MKNIKISKEGCTGGWVITRGQHCVMSGTSGASGKFPKRVMGTKDRVIKKKWMNEEVQKDQDELLLEQAKLKEWGISEP